MNTRTLLRLGAAALAFVLTSDIAQGAAIVDVNWARTGTATQSSDHLGAVAARAIDGNTSILWANNSISHTELNQPDDPPWWEVDLGASKSIGRVSVWFRVECCQNRNDDFTAIVLDDNRAEVARRRYTGRPPSNVTYDFAPAISGRYVRIEGQTPKTTSDGVLSLAEVEVIAPYDGVTINVTKQPADVSILENQVAVFGAVTVAATDVAAAKFRFQWQKNGQDIPGATSASYTTPNQKTSDSGATYTVKATLPGVSVLSSAVKVTVNQDTVPPRVTGTSVGGGRNLQFSVNYNEQMDPATATNTANYAFGGGATVTAVTLLGPTFSATNSTFFNTAVLSVDGTLPNTAYTLAISGVKDLAGNTITTTNLTGNLGLYEVNYSLAGTATQSSNLDTVHVAAVAIDGKTDGAWGANTTTHTQNTDDPPWWEVDLGSPKTFGRVSVWFRTDCCLNRNDDFTVIVLDANRAEVAKRTYVGRPPRNAFVDFAPPVQGKFVRVEGQTPRTTSDGFQSLTEVEVLVPYQNVTFAITKAPADASTLENRPVTFGPVTVAVTGAPQTKLAYQWQKNGVDIPGAYAASYTTLPISLAENGSEYSVKVTLPGLIQTAKAKVTVTKDSDPPKVDFVDATVSKDTATFEVTYNELMDPTSAADKANYALSAGASVTEATLNPDGKTAVLKVTGLGAATRYSLRVSGVKDLGGNTFVTATLDGSVQINYAVNGKASQSSDLDGAHTADVAIDGNTDGRWASGSVTHTQNTESPPVWEVDLTSVKSIGSVRVWFRTDCCQNRNDDFTVFILDAGRKEVGRRAYRGRPPASVTLNFAPAVQGQYVRIHAQSPRTTSDGYMSLAEVQVFNPYETETIGITEGLVNTTAVVGKTATLGPVKVNAPNVPPSRISYQWQKDGVDIPGAFGASYTTPVLTATDTGQYSVRALLPGVASTSVNATLTVTADTPADVRLRVETSGTGLRIAWPQTAVGFVLESSDSLSPPAWKVATEAVLVLGLDSYVTVTGQSGTKFYRLVKR
jgi:hypothetical protein